MKFRHKGKELGIATTKSGRAVKVWRNKKGEMIPTNWKLQAAYLSQGNGELVTKESMNAEALKGMPRA